MQTISFIGLHHSGPPAGFNYTFQDINNYHRQKWNLRSTLGEYGGYNMGISPIGELHQFRAIGEQAIGAVGYNFNTVHICLIGDFSKDQPTPQQVAKLKNVLLALLHKHPESMGLKVIKDTVLDIPIRNIKPHRYFTPTTECYGTGLSDNWVQDNVLKEYVSGLERLRMEIGRLWFEMLKLRQAGSVPRPCQESAK